MTQFKVGDEVQLVKDTQLFKRGKKGVIREIKDRLIHVAYKGHAGSWVPAEYLRPYTPRIRPSKSDITKLKQEIAIRNEAIDRLENDVRILHSEKVRLGETNAWLTEQNDALKKEVHCANVAWEKAKDANIELSEQQSQTLLKAEKALNNTREVFEQEQAKTALSLYIWKAVAVVAIVADLVLAFLLLY